MGKQLVWDQTGERIYETGVSKGVLYPFADNKYGTGVAWNGLTAVTESPSGAEASPLYADNIKYLNLMSAEEFGATVEAYTYPDEFAECNGEAALKNDTEGIAGISVGQQKRKTFGMSYQTKVGNDTDADAGYKIHLIYGALAAPSEKAYATVNDSPEAITFSWELTTTPIEVPGLKPTASITIDSTKVSKEVLKAIENKLYGTEEEDPTLPTPTELVELVKTATARVIEIKVETTSSQPIFNKQISEIQTNISVDEVKNKITGISNYISDFVDFNPTVQEEQEGNYLYLAFNNIKADKIEVKVEGGKKPDFLDCTSDKWCLFWLKDTATGITIKATKGDKSTTKTYDITGLTRSPKE